MTEDGPVVEEAVVRAEQDGKTLFEWRCTPIELDALVLGRLYAEGLIDNADIATAFETAVVEDDITVVRIKRAFGVVRKRAPRTTPTFIPDVTEFAELYRALFARIDERHEEGGMHAAALASEGTLMYQADDVGRHNAADKVIGMAVLDGADISPLGMIVSSRISGEIARKAVSSGVKWLASRSIPTTLALRIAREAGMPIIGRAAGKHSFLYT
jgi:formate dehydrogenase accessory protein FdhD